MEKGPGGISAVSKLSFVASHELKLRIRSGSENVRRLLIAIQVISALICISIPNVLAQNAPAKNLGKVTIQGTVLDSAGRPVDGALVRLERAGVPGSVETKTDTAGAFAFSQLGAGSYTLTAKESGLRSRATAVVASQDEQKQVRLVLEDSGGLRSDFCASSPASTPVMEFADKPDFTVAGVTDWTAAGGHGSDTSLRTSEALTRETLTLKSGGREKAAAGSAASASDASESESKLRAALAGDPGGFEANRRLGEFYLHAGSYTESVPLLEAASRIDSSDFAIQYDLALALQGAGDLSQAREQTRKLLARQETADLHRLAGELDEKLGDPLAAVHEYEQAIRMDPSETNYFEWGSELLLHRAVLQAQEVLQKGVNAYPKSARMLTALGTALFAGARYDEAALRLCEASDLNPSDPEPYTFMGKIELVAPNPMPCVEQKLARFVKLQPDNSLANYFFAMAIWKKQTHPADQRTLRHVEMLLTHAISVDPKCADAYLELGNLYSSQHGFERAIGPYSRAIEANPELAEAYYRLGVAYDRIGETAKAKLEFQLHDEIKKRQAAAIEQQRREVKQFQVVVPSDSTSPKAN
jgi:tetratricopeptide (TPR) repeat protein